MSDEIRDVMLAGFMIFPSNGKFIVRKQAVPHNELVLKDSEFETYDKAMEFAIYNLQNPVKKSWSVQVRYNRGLGIEYRNLPDVDFETYEQAIDFATLQTESLFKGQKVIVSEIKVRPRLNK